MNKCVSPSTVHRSGTRGFTLIEVMITVAIIAILAAVALPSYRSYVLRGQLVDARNLLSSTWSQQEQYYQDNRAYGPSSGACGASMPSSGTSKYFNFACSAAAASSPQSYTVTATGSGSTAGFSFTIDHQGTRRTTAVPSGWGSAPQNCWLTRKGESC
jgi:type IV pilus assembly protein PilE